eukprot:6863393-Prymnesium_polylepis.1
MIQLPVIGEGRVSACSSQPSHEVSPQMRDCGRKSIPVRARGSGSERCEHAPASTGRTQHRTYRQTPSTACRQCQRCCRS